MLALSNYAIVPLVAVMAFKAAPRVRYSRATYRSLINDTSSFEIASNFTFRPMPP